MIYYKVKMEDQSNKDTITSIEREPLVLGKWLNLFKTPEGGLLFSRPVKPGQEMLSSGSDIIALGIGADSRLKIVLEIIYRVPIAKFIIQLPAG